MPKLPELKTILSPGLIANYELDKSIVVIIDVFRATSTIAAALHNGAKEVIPVDTVDKAISIGKQIDAIAAGERDGKLAPGLKYGNSPLEYTPELISKRTLVLTTTNGTRLLKMVEEHSPYSIITGSFPNLDAVCNYLLQEGKNVFLACAAWRDKVNLEDTLFAGAVIHKIKKSFSITCDSSLMAETMYLHAKDDLLKYSEMLTHYKRLVVKYGLIKDVEFCLTSNIANVLPVYKSGRLVVV